MSKGRKTAIIVGVLVVTLLIFGFTKERYDYSDGNKGKSGGIGITSGPAFEYAVTEYNSGNIGNWDKKSGTRSMQDHLDNMGAQGWELVSVERGNFTDEYIFIFLRPVARWN
jgi:hypothetical protein